MKNLPIITIAVAIVVGGLGFFGGMKYQQTKQPTASGFTRQFMMNGNTAGSYPRNGGAANRGNGNFTRPITGEVISADDKSVTVKLSNGGSKIVLISQNTTLAKATPVTSTDLVAGTTVTVAGSTNTDGSISAQNIQIVPSSTPTK